MLFADAMHATLFCAKPPCTLRALGACKIRFGPKVVLVPIPNYTSGGGILNRIIFCLTPDSELEDLLVVYCAAIWRFGNFEAQFIGTSVIKPSFIIFIHY